MKAGRLQNTLCFEQRVASERVATVKSNLVFLDFIRRAANSKELPEKITISYVKCKS